MLLVLDILGLNHTLHYFEHFGQVRQAFLFLLPDGLNYFVVQVFQFFLSLLCLVFLLFPLLLCLCLVEILLVLSLHLRLVLLLQIGIVLVRLPAFCFARHLHSVILVLLLIGDVGNGVTGRTVPCIVAVSRVPIGVLGDAAVHGLLIGRHDELRIPVALDGPPLLVGVLLVGWQDDWGRWLVCGRIDGLPLVVDGLMKRVHGGRVLVVGSDGLEGLNRGGQVHRIVGGPGNFGLFVVPLVLVFGPQFLAVFFALRSWARGLDFNLFNNIFRRFLLLLINMRYMLSLSLWREWGVGARGHLQIIIRNFPLLQPLRLINSFTQLKH